MGKLGYEPLGCWVEKGRFEGSLDGMYLKGKKLSDNAGQ